MLTGKDTHMLRKLERMGATRLTRMGGGWDGGWAGVGVMSGGFGFWRQAIIRSPRWHTHRR